MSSTYTASHPSWGHTEKQQAALREIQAENGFEFFVLGRDNEYATQFNDGPGRNQRKPHWFMQLAYFQGDKLRAYRLPCHGAKKFLHEA